MDQGAECYRRFLDGEDAAFDELMELYREHLIFFIARSVHDRALAEDLAEDCFVELIVHPKRYNFRTALKTYLFSIAHHKTVDAIRHQVRCPSVPLEETGEEAALTDTTGLEETVFRNERSRALHGALNRIAPDYREVLHLLYFEEASYDDAARVMHKQRKQIENLAYRGRKALRAELEKEGFRYEE